MATFHIAGGRPLSGTYTPSGNKNAVLPMLAAALLTDEPVVLQNVPLIQDVRTTLDILAFLGVDVQLRGHVVTLCAANLRKRSLPRDLCRKVRSSILFAGPLAARHGRATLFPPGGDVIGRRRLDTHLLGLGALGIATEAGPTLAFRRGRAFAGADILLDEASVTATENVVMAATLAPGRTTIRNAACEPHVQDLCALLIRMGARIEGVGTNELRVEGVRFLRGASYRVQPDHIEIGSMICAAAVTGGELRVPDVRAEDLRPLERPFAKLGVRWKLQDDGSLLLPAGQTLTVEGDVGQAIPKIEDGVWPNFPSDMMSVLLVLASQARGTALFFEKMFESRMYFVDHLIDMGARLVQCDPHRVIVSGPAPLQGTKLHSPARMAASRPVIVTIGITPVEPSTAYGYIETGAIASQAGGVAFFQSKRFVEKPPHEKAVEYVQSGRYYWNSGMFVWSVETFKNALVAHRPPLYAMMQRLIPEIGGHGFAAAFKREYEQLEKISIDYAVMEKADNILMARGEFAWDDVGSWTALENHFPKDESDNTTLGDTESVDSSGNIILSRGRLTALMGVHDMIVVQTDGVTLVCPKDRAQDIKKLVVKIRDGGRHPGVL